MSSARRARELLDDDARIFLVDVDHDLLDRLEPIAGDGIGLEQHARTADAHLEAFAPHGLDQHGQLQLAAAGDLERVALLAERDPDRDVALGLALQPVPDLARGDLGAVLAGIGAVIDREGHGDGRGIDRLRRDRRLDRGLAQRVGDGGLGEARDRDDVAGLGLVDRLPLEAAERQDLGDPCLLDQLAVAGHRLDGHVGLDPARFDPAGEQAAEIGIGLQRGRQHPERPVLVGHRRRYVLDDQVEQWARGRVRGSSSSRTAQPCLALA